MSTKHGHAKTKTGKPESPTYRSWWSMKRRCEDPHDSQYHYYGGRGIQVCAQWRTSFLAFLADVGPRPSLGHSLDRYPDKDGDYKPGNVRWATDTEQNRNRRGVRLLTYQGITCSIPEWAERTGLTAEAIACRLRRGDSVEHALTAPMASCKTLTYQGVICSIPEWAERTGLTSALIYKRLARGVPVERVLTDPPLSRQECLRIGQRGHHSTRKKA